MRRNDEDCVEIREIKVCYHNAKWRKDLPATHEQKSSKTSRFR